MTVDLNGLHVAPSTSLVGGGGGGARAAATARLSVRDGHWFSGKLHPFQRRAVEFLMNHPNAVLADDVGLGKTVTVLSYIARLEENGRLRRVGTSQCRVLWLTASGLVDQTRAEIEKFLPTHAVVTSNDRLVRRASAKVTKEWHRRFGSMGPDILVLSYEDATRRASGLTSTTNPGLVVLDDANQVSGKETGKRYSAVCSLTERAPRVVSMTATPLWNDPMDLYRLLRATQVPGLWREGVFKKEFVAFRPPTLAWPGRNRRVPYAWLPGKAGEVRGFLATCMVQRSAAEAKVPTPRRTGDAVRLVDLTPSQRQAYEAVQAEPGQEVVGALTAIGQMLGVESPLADALVGELDARAGRQVFVSAERHALLDVVESTLDGMGASYVRVDGVMTRDQQADAVREFTEGRVRILLGSDVLTRGFNLSNCNELITLDPTWVDSEEYQKEGRLRGIGSPHRTFRHLALVPDHPLNRTKLQTLDRKRETAMAVYLGRVEKRAPWASALDAGSNREGEPTER